MMLRAAVIGLFVGLFLGLILPIGSASAAIEITPPPRPVDCVGSDKSLQYDAGHHAYQCARITGVDGGAYNPSATCAGAFKAINFTAPSTWSCQTDPTPSTCTGSTQALHYSGTAYSCDSLSIPASPIGCTGATDALQYDGGAGAYQCRTISVPAAPVGCTGLFDSLQYDGGAGAYQCHTDPTPGTCSGSWKALNYSGGAYSCQTDPTPTTCSGAYKALNFDGAAYACQTSPTVSTCSGAYKALNYDGAAYSCQTSPTVSTCTGANDSLQYNGSAYSCRTIDMTDYARRPHARHDHCLGAMGYNLTTFWSAGLTAVAAGAGGLAVPAVTNYLSVANSTAATINTIASVRGTSTFMLAMQPRFTATYNSPSGTAVRRWIGLAQAVATMGGSGSDTPLTTFVAFRYSTSIPDTNWQLCWGDGAATTCADTGVPFVAAAMEPFVIDCGASTCTGYVGTGGVLSAGTTVTPTAGLFTANALEPFVNVTATTGTGKNFHLGEMCVELKARN